MAGASAGSASRTKPAPKPANPSRALNPAGVRRIAMVSGDRQPVAARVAREIGCEEVVAECLPQNKVEFVRQFKGQRLPRRRGRRRRQ
jgi:cation transport ATPase